MTSNSGSVSNEVFITDMLIDNNLIIDAEVGMSLGGNDDEEDGPRWNNMKVTNNVLTKLGESRATNRNLAWGIEIDDWFSGEVSNNHLHGHGSDIVTNTIPIQLKGACTDILVDGNVCWNIGITTGEDNHPTGLRWNEAGDVGFAMTGVVVSNNYFQSPDKQSLVLDSWEAQPGLTMTDNHYYSARDPNEWFRLSRAGEGDTYNNYAGWQAESEITDTGAVLTETVWVDDTRTIETYMASLGQTPTLEAFLAKAKEMAPGNFNPAYTAAGYNAYHKAGFTPV